MPELKKGFEELDFTEVTTYLNSDNVVFWSFCRKDYQKTNWWSKTAGLKVSDKITIRTVNTVRKIFL